MEAPERQGVPSRLSSSSDLKESPESRITRIETQIESLATKEELEKLKVWILRGVAAVGVAIMVIALGAFFREVFSQMFTPQSSLSSGAASSPAPVPSVPSAPQYQAGAGCDAQQIR